jgi:mono/diheme cytochrome c family protein
MRRTNQRRLQRPVLLATGIAMMISAFLMSVGTDTVAAKSSFLGDFNTRYGTAGSVLDSCSTCHSAIPSLNSYGTAWKNNGKNFAGIESLDSDGDSFTNLQEIQALTWPGDPSSFPSGGTTTTTTPPSTTLPPTTTLPPPASGPLTIIVDEFKPPGSVDVNAGNVTRRIKVKALIEDAEEEENVTADIRLYANGVLSQTDSVTRRTSDDGKAEYETSFDFNFTPAHVPKIDWWVIVVVNGQASPTATAATVVSGPAPTTTTTVLVPTTTMPPDGGGGGGTGGSINGATIYSSACAGCHGANGEGGFGGPVAGTTMNHGQVVAITTNGQGGMPSYSGQFTAAEIDAVATFVLSLGDGPPVATTTTTLPAGVTPGSGGALYRQHCAACHGANADGGIGGTLVASPLSFSQQVSVTSRGRESMPGFNSVLTSDEIASVVRYALSHGSSGATTATAAPDQESGAAVYGRLCTACHGAGGSGGSGGAIAGSTYHGTALANLITEGIGTMPGFGSQLNDGQVTRLVVYVEGLFGGVAAGDASSESLLGALPGSTSESGSQEGFTGHASEGSVETVEAGPVSPVPIGNPIGWVLALAIAGALMAAGSLFAGSLPNEAESVTVDTPGSASDDE